MATVGRAHHTGLTVSNLERSIEFYEVVLDCELVVRQDKSGGYLARILGYPDCTVKMAQLKDSAGVHVVELFEFLSPTAIEATLEPRRIGNAHVCFLVDDLHAAYERLVARNVTILSHPVPVDTGVNAGGWGLYLRDPDGITIELFQPPPAEGFSGLG